MGFISRDATVWMFAVRGAVVIQCDIVSSAKPRLGAQASSDLNQVAGNKGQSLRLRSLSAFSMIGPTRSKK